MQHELNNRENNGISTVLIWDDETSETYIELETSDEWHRFAVQAHEASDAFAHPFVYLTRAVTVTTLTAAQVQA